MKYIVLFLTLSLFSCKKEVSNKIDETKAVDQVFQADLKVYDFNGFEPFLNKTDDKTHVINFWATWCAPCVVEMPHFEKLNAAYKTKGVEVLLVSLDFPFQYDKKLKPFIKEKNIQSKVVALDDPDMNTWMPKVNEEWTGAIPITIIYNKNRRQFYERSFTYDQLETELKQFLN